MTTTFACPEVVRDVLAYLVLAQDPRDDLAFRRICNSPARGIGLATEEVIVKHAMEVNCTIYDALWHLSGDRQDRSASLNRIHQFGNRLAWLELGYAHENWDTDDFLDVIFIEDYIGYETFALTHSRSPDDVTATIRMLRRMAAEDTDLTMFLERFPAEWVTLQRPV